MTTQQARNRRNGGRQSESPDHTPPSPAAPAAPELEPLDHALRVMRDETKSDSLRAQMARTAMPYVHKRGERQAQREDEKPPQEERWSDLEIARRIAHILTLADQDGDNAETVGAAAAMPYAKMAPDPAAAERARADALERRALAAEAELAALKEKEAERKEAEALAAQAAGEGDLVAQIVALKKKLLDMQSRATTAESKWRQAEMRAHDMEQRACATEAILAGTR